MGKCTLTLLVKDDESDIFEIEAKEVAKDAMEEERERETLKFQSALRKELSTDLGRRKHVGARDSSDECIFYGTVVA